jgi:hypothetical protein
MASIQELARKHFGQDVTRKRPTKSYNSSGQLDMDYSTTTDVTLNLVIIKSKADNKQEKQGIPKLYPAYSFGKPDEDIEEWDLLVTTTETYQVLNKVVKANNITGALGYDTPYYYCDLVLFGD